MNNPKNNSSSKLSADEIQDDFDEDIDRDSEQDEDILAHDDFNMIATNKNLLLSGDKCIPILYYFPGKFDTKTYFGHVAIGNLPPTNEAKTGYLTFGKVSEKMHKSGVAHLVKNDEVPTYPFLERQVYGKCIPIMLPLCSWEKVKTAIKSFTDLDRNQYSILKNNDAQAAVNFLRDAGYSVPAGKDLKMPKEVALLAGKIALDALLIERGQLLNDKTQDCMLQISQLIENDKRRLKLQLAIDDISRLLTSRLISLAEIKIKKLDELLVCFKADNPDYERCFKKLVRTASEVGSITGKNLMQCVAFFSYLDIQEKIAILKIKKEIAKVLPLEILAQQRRQILEEEGIDGVERILMLMDNDIQRLNNRIGRDKPGFLINLVKGNVKAEEIIQLENLEAMLKQKTIDYQACINIMIAAEVRAEEQSESPKFEKALMWQEYLEFFPFDKLSGMDDKRLYLVKLEVALQNAALKTQGSEKRFLGKEFPAEIIDLQNMITLCKALPDAMDRDIYFLFEDITNKIRKEKDIINQPNVKAFYQEWYRASLEVQQSQYILHVVTAA